jgi:hypothetical protein
MRNVFLVAAIIVLCPLLLLSGNTRVIYIPEDILIEENAQHVTTIRNLSDFEIYRPGPIVIFDGFIYITQPKYQSIVKISLQGFIKGRFGKKGEGPREMVGLSGISRFNDNIAISGRNKVIICTRDLQYIREIKLKQRFHNLLLATNKKIYFYNNPSFSNYYFTVYTKDFKYFKKFAIKKPGAKDLDERQVNYRNYKYSSDYIRAILYVPENNGIWISIRNRYELRYYINERAVVKIKSKVQLYTAVDDIFSGVKIKTFKDYPLAIGKNGNQLYHCFKWGEGFFCDVFDLSDNYRLIRRLKLPHQYWRIVHSKGLVFYGLRYDEDHENVFLDKIKIQEKGGH